MLLVSEIKLGLYEDENLLQDIVSKKLRIKKSEIESFTIHKKSLDARKQAIYKYQVLIKIKNETKYLRIKNVTLYKEFDIKTPKLNSSIRPLIIGYGPSGIFCAYRLVEAGLKPIVFERGKRIDKREKDVERFFREGILDTSSNVQFGEGGAGTFSDAKLTTRIKNPFVDYILDVFIKFGAKKSIKFTPHSHIGSDDIRVIISAITDYLRENGCEFHFEEELKELLVDDKHEVYGIKTNKETYNSPICLLGVGHSAFDTIEMLFNKGVHISSKDMAIGFRVEHPQSLIDNNQINGEKAKEPAEYFLKYKDKKGVYSFCMCPGGLVIPASSNYNRIVTNGMSYAKRDSGIANSAILVQINKEEYGQDPLDGFYFLKNYEQKAYHISNSYKALSQNISDYLDNKLSNLIMESTYPLGTVLYNFNDFFSSQDNMYFKKALRDFDSKIPGFINQGIMVGPETRSSCPCRINRDETYQSVNTKGLYPMGEGAGYGGGIMSCGLDGIRIANSVINALLNNSY